MLTMNLGTALDSTIGVFSPQRALKRAQARAGLSGLHRARMLYEGATRSERAGYWVATGSSANTEIRRALPILRNRHRDLVRNNPYAANIVTAIVGQVVGAGIVYDVMTSGVRSQKSLERLAADHLETPAIDVDGRNDLFGLQALVMRTVVESGEALIVRYTPPPRLNLPVPMQVKVIEPDYLNSSINGPMPGGNVAFEGIEFDSDGRRVAYHLFNEHPGGGLSWNLPRTTRIAAEQVIHIFRVDRPGQARGVPWGAPAIMTLRDLHDYEDATLLRQKIAACFVAFRSGTQSSSLAGSISSERSDGGQPIETFEPGTILNGAPGETMTFGNPPVANDVDYRRAAARKVCCGFSVPYELGTGDLANVSFISGRLGMLQFNRNVDQWRWHMLIPHACAGITRWFMDAAAIALQAQQIEARFEWSPPRRELIDPSNEVPAMSDMVRNGFETRSEQVRSLGGKPKTVEQEFSDENDRADVLKLRFDSDGRFPKNTRGSETLPLAPGAGAVSPGKLNGSAAQH